MVDDPTKPQDQVVEPQAPSDPPVEPVKPVELVTPTAPVTPEPPKVDEGAIADKVSKSVLERIAGALGLNKEEKKQLPTDPDELAAFIKENAKKGTEEVLTQREQQDKDAREAQEKQQTEGAQRFQTLWKDQYNQLAEAGRVPKITNPDDKNDPGNLAKVKILTKLKQIIDDNAAKGIDYVPTLKEVFYEYPDVLRTDTIAGANTPISGGGRVMANSTNSLPYDQLHKAGVDDLVARKYN